MEMSPGMTVVAVMTMIHLNITASAKENCFFLKIGQKMFFLAVSRLFLSKNTRINEGYLHKHICQSLEGEL